MCAPVQSALEHMPLIAIPSEHMPLPAGPPEPSESSLASSASAALGAAALSTR